MYSRSADIALDLPWLDLVARAAPGDSGEPPPCRQYGELGDEDNLI